MQTMTRTQFRDAIFVSIYKGEYFGPSLQPSEVRQLRVAAETIRECAVGSFGDPSEPERCQCPATQAGLQIIGNEAAVNFGIDFDYVIESRFGQCVSTVLSLRIEDDA